MKLMNSEDDLRPEAKLQASYGTLADAARGAHPRDACCACRRGGRREERRAWPSGAEVGAYVATYCIRERAELIRKISPRELSFFDIKFWKKIRVYRRRFSLSNFRILVSYSSESNFQSTNHSFIQSMRRLVFSKTK